MEGVDGWCGTGHASSDPGQLQITSIADVARALFFTERAIQAHCFCCGHSTLSHSRWCFGNSREVIWWFSRNSDCLRCVWLKLYLWTSVRRKSKTTCHAHGSSCPFPELSPHKLEQMMFSGTQRLFWIRSVWSMCSAVRPPIQ